MTNTRMILLATSTLFLVACNADGQVDALADANAKLVKDLQASKTPAEAKKIYDEQIATIKPMWTAAKELRGFQVSDEAKAKLETTAVESVQAACSLEIRGVFDEEAKKSYATICEDYAEMLEVGASLGRMTVMDKMYAAESFAGDFKKAKEGADKPEGLNMPCISLDTHAKTAKDYGFEAQFNEYKEICTFTVPMNKLKAAVEKAEAARKASPDETVLSACYSADQSMALKDLTEAKRADDPKIKDLTNRWEKACPKKK